MPKKEFMCECGKGFATKYSKIRHQQTTCKFHAKIDGCPSPYPLIEETNKMAEQTISREQPTDQVVTIETPAHQLHQNMAIGERRSRKRNLDLKIRRNRENQSKAGRKRPNGVCVRAARQIAPSILLRRPMKFQFEEHDINESEFNAENYPAQPSNNSISESKPTSVLQQIINVESNDGWTKHTEVAVCTQLCDASTQTDPQQFQFHLNIHSGNRFVFKVLP